MPQSYSIVDNKRLFLFPVEKTIWEKYTVMYMMVQADS